MNIIFSDCNNANLKYLDTTALSKKKAERQKDRKTTILKIKYIVVYRFRSLFLVLAVIAALTSVIYPELAILGFLGFLSFFDIVAPIIVWSS